MDICGEIKIKLIMSSSLIFFFLILDDPFYANNFESLTNSMLFLIKILQSLI